MEKTRFTVAISAYNIESYVKRAIDSVLNQTFTDYELLVIDDCSKDNTVQIIEESLNGKGIILKTIKNSGTAAASRNIAIDNAQGEYLLFLDGDDELYSKDTLKEIDKQYSRTLWEFEGTELAIDVDASILQPIENGIFKIPSRKKRLFRKLSFDETKDKTYNIFSPEIRDTSLFNGLNEYLRQAENECGIAYGTLSKMDEIAKTATEIKSSKQDYYVTVSDIQFSMQNAFDDLIYGIYVLCKLYNIPVKSNYVVEHDWDDSILVDKESARNQALIERNADITSDVQYIMETRNMKEKEAIEFVKKQKEYRKITEELEENPPEEE